MNKKLFYTAPTSKLFEVRMEGFIAASDDPNGYHSGGGGSYDGNSTNDNDDY